MARIVDAVGGCHGRELSYLEAAELLGIGERYFRRLRDRYEAEGAEGSIDRRRDRASARRAPLDRIERVLEQYRTHDVDFTVKHFHEELEKQGFEYGYTWTKSLLQARGLVGRARTRSAQSEQQKLAGHERFGPHSGIRAGAGPRKAPADCVRKSRRWPELVATRDL